MTMPHRFCKGCDYDLSAAPEARCPECGRVFDPAHARSYCTFSRRSWRGRWRRWRPVILPIVVLAMLWPRGWSLLRLTWNDPTGKGSVQTRALVIGRPWWLGGWYPPITWTTTDGAGWQPPGEDTYVSMGALLWNSHGPWLWKGEVSWDGRIGINRPAVGSLSDREWKEQIRQCVRGVARESAALSAGEPTLRAWFSAVPWLDEAFKQPPPR